MHVVRACTGVRGVKQAGKVRQVAVGKSSSVKSGQHRDTKHKHAPAIREMVSVRRSVSVDSWDRLPRMGNSSGTGSSMARDCKPVQVVRMVIVK